jgi:threonylcarbamoyladenosine tRNA methylthiotransferase MtaB
MHSFYIKTFGCKLNQYESQLIRENLYLNSWPETDNAEQAEYVLINSCCVTDNAVRDIKKFIRSLKRKDSNLKIAVLGCLVDLYPQELQGFNCDILLGNKDKFNLGNRLVKTKDRIEEFKGHTRAFVKVQNGCDNRCSYCCVWMARGPSYSRDYKDILSEIESLLNRGYREIVLTGCCLGSFGKDKGFSLSSLLKDINRIKQDFRVRLSSIEPQDITKELIDTIILCDKVVAHLHIPLQSGSDKILSLMGRKYDRDYFKRLVLKLKTIDHFQFSTDIIVGFPGEDEEDFKDTLAILRELMPVRVHTFPYSPRPKTAAYELAGQISRAAVVKRHRKAQSEVKELVLENLRQQLGEVFYVLIERELDGFWQGYSENYIKIKVKSNENLKNKLLLVKTAELDLDQGALLALPLH